jgi:uncharacterized repeat protein (TIGR03987 family)
MPVNIIVGLVALLVALILYSMGALGAFRSKSVTRRHVTYLWIGLAFDTVATAMMAIEAGGLDLSPLPDLLHTIVAFLAMFGMLAVVIAGTRAVMASNDQMRAAVAKWALAPWVLWVFVFVWGMISRGSARMGG